MNPRDLLKTSGASALAGAWVLDGNAAASAGAAASPTRPRAPHRARYRNDMTHVAYCISPYCQRGDKWTPEMLLASVDETAGRGVAMHMLQPGLGRAPSSPEKGDRP